MNRRIIKIPFFFLFPFGMLFAQTGWQPWQKVYSDQMITVELQINIPPDGCDPNGKQFKYRGKLTGALRTSPAYVNFKMDFVSCSGTLYYQYIALSVWDNNGGAVNGIMVESLDYKFSASSIAETFYDVELLYTQKTGSGVRPPIPRDNMVLVKGGQFTRGCTAEQGIDCDRDEKTIHTVTLNDFYICKYEVTQKQWTEVMGTNPSGYRYCENCPIEQVTWENIQVFLRKLNEQTGLIYRLPTEAEWEYAARGGRSGSRYKYAGSDDIEAVAWHRMNAGGHPQPVGTKQSNELGLFDMSGNVWEWCSDWKADYGTGHEYNPAGPPEGTERVIRGGSWYNDTRAARVSYRNTGAPTLWSGSIGFRLVRER